MSNILIDRKKLFIASCVALITTAMAFAIRADLIIPLGKQFGLDQSQLNQCVGTAFWGFTLAMTIGGPICDIIGLKKLLIFAFLCHIIGVILTILSGGFWSLWFSTLLVGLGNGFVEAACNPLVATLYPEDKTKKLNHFHLWFPGGIVIGGLLAYFIGKVMVNADGTEMAHAWQIKMATMFVPAIAYGYLAFGLKFPQTERVSSGVSTANMFKSCLTPLFIVMFFSMMMTAATELGTNQWISKLLGNVGIAPILLLVFINGIMTIGRGFAGPIVHRIAPEGMLLFSAIFAAIGLYLLSITSGYAAFGAAAVFAVGVCFFWPTMIGFVAEYLPRTGALGVSLMGGAGMFGAYLFPIIIGSIFGEQAIAEGGSTMLSKVALMPIFLIVVFAIINFVVKPRVNLKNELHK